MSITLVKNHSRHINRNICILLYTKCFLTFLLLTFVLTVPKISVSQERYRLVFWNVENLFDTFDDSTRNDDIFTPTGENHWNNKRYKTKLTHLYQTFVAIGSVQDKVFDMPLAIGLAEVENDKVLRDLTKGTPLRRFNYDFIHFDSPDQRGIDNALLFKKKAYKPFLSRAICVSDSSKGYFTRDILLVEGTTDKGDTIVFLVNHFPSRLGGTTADKQRMAIAKRLRYIMDTISTSHPSATIVVMGDFNSTPKDTEIKDGLMHKDDTHFINLMASAKAGQGSYNYQGHWSFLDQIIVSHNLADIKSTCPLTLYSKQGQAFEADFLLIDDEKNLKQKPFRTYLGVKYQGGYSDHLPVYIDLIRK